MVGGLLTTMLQPYCLYVIEAPPVSSLTALEPQPSRLKIDLPLKRASPAWHSWPFVLVAVPWTPLGWRSIKAGLRDWQTWVVVALLFLRSAVF